jgi:hypothetical protein
VPCAAPNVCDFLGGRCVPPEARCVLTGTPTVCGNNEFPPRCGPGSRCHSGQDCVPDAGCRRVVCDAEIRRVLPGAGAGAPTAQPFARVVPSLSSLARMTFGPDGRLYAVFGHEVYRFAGRTDLVARGLNFDWPRGFDGDIVVSQATITSTSAPVDDAGRAGPPSTRPPPRHPRHPRPW